MIYLLRAGPDGPVKIGWSTNVEQRMKTIQFIAPAKLVLLRTMDVPRWAEWWLHDQFNASRLDGEWFTFHPDMLTIEVPREMPAGLTSRPAWSPYAEPIADAAGDVRLIVPVPRDLLAAIDAAKVARNVATRQYVSRAMIIRDLIRRGLNQQRETTQ